MSVRRGIGALRRLRVLNLSGNSSAVDDAVVDVVGQNLAALTQLDIAGCYSVSDVGVLALRQCLQLWCLDLSDLEQVTDDAIFGRPLLLWPYIVMAFIVMALYSYGLGAHVLGGPRQVLRPDHVERAVNYAPPT